MRYSILFMLLVIVGGVVHVDRAQTPDLAVRYFESGQKKFDEHDWVAAADYFTKAIQINAMNKGVKAKKKAGNAFDQSQETTEISVSDTFTAHAYVNRGAAHFYSGAFDQSIADYEHALRIDPRLAEAYLGHGAALNGKGDRVGAMRDYDRALKLDARLYEAYNNR